jgi:hypothetical protein
LAAKASSVVDVGEIITSGEPDAEGNVIPASVGFGGYQVRKVDVRADQTVTTEALVFDRRSKNFLTFYNTCCGITPGSVGFSLAASPARSGLWGRRRLRARIIVAGDRWVCRPPSPAAIRPLPR